MEYFDKIFIINLEKRKDRLKHILDQLNKNNIKNFEIFTAIRPNFKDIPKKYYSNIKKFLFKNKNYIIGFVGCKLSHYEVIKIAKERSYKKILILEDDTVFKSINIHFPENWDMLYLGLNLKEYEKHSDNLVKIKRGFCTNSYAVHEKMYDIILNNCLDSGIEIDQYYNTLFKKSNCYCIFPQITYQRPDYSDIAGGFRNYITHKIC